MIQYPTSQAERQALIQKYTLPSEYESSACLQDLSSLQEADFMLSKASAYHKEIFARIRNLTTRETVRIAAAKAIAIMVYKLDEAAVNTASCFSNEKIAFAIIEVLRLEVLRSKFERAGEPNLKALFNSVTPFVTAEQCYIFYYYNLDSALIATARCLQDRLSGIAITQGLQRLKTPSQREAFLSEAAPLIYPWQVELFSYIFHGATITTAPAEKKVTPENILTAVCCQTKECGKASLHAVFSMGEILYSDGKLIFDAIAQLATPEAITVTAYQTIAIHKHHLDTAAVKGANCYKTSVCAKATEVIMFTHNREPDSVKAEIFDIVKDCDSVDRIKAKTATIERVVSSHVSSADAWVRRSGSSSTAAKAGGWQR
jgi:hypothetical protein